MKNILEYLENTERKYPYRLAADDGKICVTWSTLAALSRQMGTVIGRKVSSGSPVVILAEKSVITLTAMLGCVYAGGFYVMADPSLPVARLQEIFRQVQPELVVVEPSAHPLLRQAGYGGAYCLVNEAIQQTADHQLLEERRRESSENDLLYVLFTSGSTGKPKGIAVSHRAVMDFISRFTEIFGIENHDRLGNQAPFDFDISVKDIYSCIMTGAALIMIPRTMFSSPPVLLDYLCDKEVTVLIWAVSALTTVSALKGLAYRQPHSVRKILFSGEVMPAKQLSRWRAALPKTEFVNLYGPSEITCNCTYYRIPDIFDENEKLPVGKPFPGRRVFLMDKEGREIRTPRTTGEICVAGESLAAGYYKNREETEKKFVLHTFLDGTKGRCYKTGDLGYFLEDGTFYFEGRKDFQIKHMGHRIELEEIEQALNKLEGIEKSCCLLDRKRNQLAAFYTGELPSGQIREQLKRKLPVYMIPHSIRHTKRMPLNKNGKTDREYLLHLLEGNA